MPIPSHRRLPSLLMLLVIAATMLPLVPAPATAQTEAETRAVVGRVTLLAEPGIGVQADDLATAYGPAITEAWSQYQSLFATEPDAPQYIAFVRAANPENLTGMRWVNDFSWASPDGTVAIIEFGGFSALSPEQSTNVLRNVLSRGFLQGAANNNLPNGLVDGVARYLETPIVARQSRLGSLVQAQQLAGTLPDWNTIITSTAKDLPPETQEANAYALVAFIVDRYGIGALRDFVTAFATHPTWPEALKASTGQDEAALAAPWQKFLPRWFASGWRENAASAFDLSRAQELFDRGAYEAAASEASRSQRLFTEIDDEAGLSRVEVLLAQCAVGLQADNLMAEAQKSLEAHNYPDVLNLVAEADALYANLPDNHRPTDMIASYTALANQGVQATGTFESARRRSGNWLDIAGARGDAVTAGNTFAALGDTERADAAKALVHQIDQRLWRMRLALTALVVVLAMWLGTWLWFRQPARLRWPRAPLAWQSRASVGR